jgi:hypothetical protein
MPTSAVRFTRPGVQMANTDAGIHAADTGSGGRVVATTLIVSVEGSSAFARTSSGPIFATNGARRPRHRRPITDVGAAAAIALVTVALLIAVAIVSVAVSGQAQQNRTCGREGRKHCPSAFI